MKAWYVAGMPVLAFFLITRIVRCPAEDRGDMPNFRRRNEFPVSQKQFRFGQNNSRFDG